MTPERWATVESLCWRLLELPPADREPTLREIRDTDPALAHEVEALLREADDDPTFLDTPIADASAFTRSDDPDADLRVGPYRLVRPLGRGGMGEVYLAVQEEDDVARYVALKVIRSDLASDSVLERFRAERRILAGLDHPAIARLFHVGSAEDGRPYLAMEYVQGVPVTDHLQASRPGLRERIRLFQRICAAVQHAHQRMVVHRDLKPGNVIVTPQGDPKLLDFGIARVLADEEVDGGRTGAGGPDTVGRGGGGNRGTARRAGGGDTGTGRSALTPRYAAPEQRTGGAVGPAADVYALGVLLYEILTGSHPTGVHEAAARGERAPLPEAATLPPDLASVVRRAMHPEPERRYWSPGAMAEDLDRFLEDRPVAAHPASAAYLARKFVRRNRVGSAAAAIVLLLLVGFAGVTSVQSRRLAEEAARTARERDEALAVRTFLLEAFSTTGPDQPAGDSLTARALLDRRVAVLDQEYGHDPGLRAEMMAVLADGYERLGLLTDAEPLARAAVDLRVEHFGESDPDLPGALNLLGWIEHRTGRTERADSTLRRAVQLARARYPDGHPTLARALNDLGVTLEARGRWDEAEERYGEALAMRRELLGDDNATVAVTASNLSVVRYRRGDLTGAAEMAGEAREIFIRALGPDHQRTMIVETNLAAMQAAAGEWGAARDTYRDILERRRRIYGERHLSTAQSMLSLASTMTPGAADPEIEALLRNAVEIQREALGPDHPQVASTTGRLASVIGREDHRTAESIELFERALAGLRTAFGEEHPEVGQALALYAEAVTDSDAARAETLYREAIRVQSAALGPDHQFVSRTRISRATNLMELGRHADAAAEVDRAWTALIGKLPDDHVRLQEARVARARWLAETGEVAAADSVLREAEGLLRDDHDRFQLAERIETLRERLDQGDYTRAGAGAQLPG